MATSRCVQRSFNGAERLTGLHLPWRGADDAPAQRRRRVVFLHVLHHPHPAGMATLDEHAALNLERDEPVWPREVESPAPGRVEPMLSDRRR